MEAATSSAANPVAGLGQAAQNVVSTSRNNTINTFTGTQYSQRYHALYRKRITLPVFEYRADFMRLLAEHQTIVLVGETGKYFWEKFCWGIALGVCSDCDCCDVHQVLEKPRRSRSGVLSMLGLWARRVSRALNHVEWQLCLWPNECLRKWM